MNKKCNCCKKIHETVPANARPDIQEGVLVAWLWECECGSTLYFYKFELEVMKAMLVEGII